ncbi:MAG: phosphatidate cytidylyltransferase [Clostridiales bacterium]|nr:phosphatidate cytidylyltransferase [Clostridiales bacterium]
MFDKKFFAGAAYFLLALPLFHYSHTAALPIVLALIAARCVYEALWVSGYPEARAMLPASLALAAATPFFAHLPAPVGPLLCYLYLMLALLRYLLHYREANLLQTLYAASMTLALSQGIGVAARARLLFGGGLGLWVLVLTFVGTWASDVAAQFSGKLFGRHKLGTPVSPNKTVEGCVGALAVTALVFAAAAWLLQSRGGHTVPLLPMAGLGLLVSVAAQLGDLLASAVKRQFGIKDFSNLIPGHGGMYDRFDSFVAVAPLVYLAFRLMEGSLI